MCITLSVCHLDRSCSSATTSPPYPRNLQNDEDRGWGSDGDGGGDGGDGDGGGGIFDLFRDL